MTSRVLDADAHVVEPAHVFADILPAGVPVFDLPPDTPHELCGDLELVRDQLDHGFDASSYLRAMDAQGIDAAVLYPSMGLFVPYLPELSPEAVVSACRAYNDWIAAYCAADPGRLAAVAIVPRDPRAAAAEVHRAAALGLVGATVRPNHLGGEYLDGLSWSPLYHALEETGGVLAVHEALGVRRGVTIGSDRFTGFAARHTCSHPMEQMTAAVALLLGGVLDRHPALRVAFLESGTGWLPYWLHRLDEHHEWAARAVPAGRARRPSEAFAQQCVVSSDPEDAFVAFVVDHVGADHVMWASDFPHPDAHFPDAVGWFRRESCLGPVELRTVLWETPLAFYRLTERFSRAPVHG